MLQKSGLQIVEIEITSKCNLNCKHCYVNKKNPKNLNPKKIFKLIEECSDLGVHRLVFTGGEPLLVKDLFKYAKYAKEKNIPEIVLMTNGLLINKENIKDIKVFDIVQLSIDVPPGAKPHLRPDYLNDLLVKIKILKENDIKVILQATLHKSLIPLLNKLGNFAQKNKVQIGFNRLSPVGMAVNLKKEILTPLELKNALEKVTKMRMKNKLIRCSDPLLFLVDNQRKKYFRGIKKKGIIGGCIAGIAALYIDVNGDVFPCAFLRYSVANVYKEKLENIWFKNELLNKLRRREFLGKCGSCKYNSFCGGCRASSFKETGSLFNSDNNCWLKSTPKNTKIYFNIFNICRSHIH